MGYEVLLIMPKFRALEEKDIKALQTLHRALFGVNRKNNFWKWKYAQNPSGSHMMAICETENSIIGQVGTIPVRMKVKESEVLAGQTQDILIYKGYRKGGIFFKLARFATEMMSERGVEFSYGFSIELTRKISTRLLGYKDIGRIEKMVKPINAVPYLERNIKNPFIRNKVASIINPFLKLSLLGFSKKTRLPLGWRMNKVDTFDERFDEFWKLVKRDYPPIMTVRNSSYLNWRYSLHPEVSYVSLSLVNDKNRILGFIVMEVKDKIRSFESLDIEAQGMRRGEIVDILVSSKDRDKIYGILFTHAIQYFMKVGVDVISCWVVEGSHLYKFLANRGFVKRPTPHNLIVRKEKEYLPYEDIIFNYSNWYITRGDCDHY